MSKPVEDREAFDTDTFHRMTVEAARFWLIEAVLRTKKLPKKETRFAYAEGPVSFDWGNSPGPDDPNHKPLRRKRVRITFEVEDT